MATKRTSARFPPSPRVKAPTRWISIDPASGRKPTMCVEWQGVDAVAFREVRHNRHADVSESMAGAELVVLEGGGFVGKSAGAALALERVRGRFEAHAAALGRRYVEVTPDEWRSVLCLAARPRKKAVSAGRFKVAMLGRPASSPHVPLAAEASNDDKRAALLLGWACVRAWGWL